MDTNSHTPDTLSDHHNPEAISLEAQREIAGLSQSAAPDTSLAAQALPEEMQLDPDAEEVSQSNPRPIKKAVVLLGGLAALGLAGWAFVSSLSPKTAQTPTPQDTDRPKPEIVKDESSQLRGRLAFQDQKRALESSPQPTPNRTPTPKPQTSPVPVRTASAPAAIPASPPPPYSNPAPEPRSVPSTANPIAPLNAPRTAAKPPQDPFKQWAQLAELGETEAKDSGETEAKSDKAADPIAAGSAPTSNSTATQTPALTVASLPTVELGREKELPEASLSLVSDTAVSESLTPGGVGILRNDPTAADAAPTTLLASADGLTPGLFNSDLKTVAMGSVTTGRIDVPMIWDLQGGGQTGGSNQQGNRRFTVSITKPLMATDGTIALPAGSQIIAEATEVSNSKLVSASAIAVVYRKADGTMQQEAIPPNALLIRGEAGGALMAQTGKSGSFGSDLMIGLMSAAGRAGQIFNQPEQSASSSVNGGGFSSSTITTQSRSPNLAAGLVDGFFSTTSQRVQERTARREAEREKQNQVAALSSGEDVAIVVNAIFRIQP